MIVKFYNMTSPTIKISKTKTYLGEAPAEPNPTGPVNIVDPSLIIDKDRVPVNANYMEIPDYERSYFIVSIDWTTANTAIVSGHSDVLSNFTPSGKLNFIRGAGSLTEMDDMSYPISDYMVEEYFPMTTWTDIFTAKGSGRQYLLRTVSATAKSYPQHQLSDGNVFCDSNLYYIRESDDATMYKCWKFSETTRTYTPSYVPRQDMTGIPVIFDGDYILCNGHVWRWRSETAVGRDEYPSMIYLS